MSTVDAQTGQALSPYYPPEPRALAQVLESWVIERGLVGSSAARRMPLPEIELVQRALKFEAKAVSLPRRIPQGYLNFSAAGAACARAGKRLCTLKEWVTACRGQAQTKFPYGANYVAGVCNVYRGVHPALVLHGSASVGHRDPRLNLVYDGESPLLKATGESAACASNWGRERLYDMVGNLDEWVFDEDLGAGVFVGGFYARSTTQGCEAKITAHAERYFDYSTGARCCADLN